MARPWWVFALLGCACSDPDHGTDEPVRRTASLTMTLSEPGDSHSCLSAAPTAYHVGSEEAPLTDGHDVVGCSIHGTETDSWFEGNLQGVEDGGANVVFTISTETELSIALVSDLTGTLLLDEAAGASCVPTFTATIGNAISAEFDCPLLADPNDATSGCGVSGTVNFDHCDME